MHYTLTARSDASFDVTCRVDDVADETLDLQLPAWRPGRYELQHFAKNIRVFGVVDQDGNTLPVRKLTKDRWQVQTAGVTAIEARYNYYGLLAGDHKLDAGSSYADERFWSVNPVNLCVYAEDRLAESCTLELAIPDRWHVACGLPKKAFNLLIASDYHSLVDAPFIASGSVWAVNYRAENVPMTIWIQNWPGVFDANRMARDFTLFTEAQIRLFGEFPQADFYFLTVVLPVAYYHGVEHRNSTHLVLGPDTEGEGLYVDLLGVASHELFHAWNICRIRPVELLPYDYTRENYFTTCFVAEGITTYYGDLMLRRAGVFDDEAYLKELLVVLKRHFEQANHAALSLTESSYDLWLDGYVKGVPDRKVSVYHKGAIVSLILDLHLRRQTAHTRSLDDVMRLLWTRFGKPFIGYTYADYRAIVADVAGDPLDWYFDTCITGTAPLDDLLNEHLAFVGLRFYYDDAGLVLLEREENGEWGKWFKS